MHFPLGSKDSNRPPFLPATVLAPTLFVSTFFFSFQYRHCLIQLDPLVEKPRAKKPNSMEHIKGKVTPFRQAYLRWCALRNVPFRKKFFVGYDLDGNTYWEFYNENNPLRPRRIVEYRETLGNWVDYKMPPQWMQWLRFTRPHYPTLEELHADKVRQEVLKLKVKAAEERWKSIPLKERGTPLSAHDVLQQYQSQATVAAPQPTMAPPSPEQMFKPPRSADDLSPEERASIPQRPAEVPVEELQKNVHDKYAEPPKPVVRANPSEAFEPGTWTKKPASRG